MKKIIGLLISLYSFNLQAQTNLVLNPSFEDKFTCINTSLLLEDYIYFWYGGRGYFNTCFSSTSGVDVPNNQCGNQMPRTGNAYCGIYTFSKSTAPPFALRNYIQTKFNQNLLVGKKYRVAFYVSLGDTMHASNNTIGAHFSSDSLFTLSNGIIAEIPQIENDNNNDLSDKTIWKLVCDTFVAAGNERWMTIGNFYTDSLSEIAALDSVCAQPNAYACSAYYYIDDVSVTLIDETGITEQKLNNFSLFPNPNNGNFRLHYKGIIAQPLMLYITDVFGKLVDSKKIVSTDSDYENTGLTNGLYFYILRQGVDEVGRGKFLIVK